MVDDRAFESVIGVDIGNELVERDELGFRIWCRIAAMHQFNAYGPGAFIP